MFSFNSDIAAAVNEVNRVAHAKAFKIGNLVRNHIITQMRGSKTGKTYKVGGTGKKYVASAPSEYPAIPTGILRSSVKTVTKVEQGNVYAIIGTDILHGLFLEKKDIDKGGRKFLSRSIDELSSEIDAIVKEQE